MVHRDEIRNLGHALLRLGIGIVLLWFGFSQLKNPASWTRLLPEFTQAFGFAPTSLIYINGIFEVTLAILLITGLLTRLVGFIAGVHILYIAYLLGYGPTAVRDLGLALAAFSVALHGADDYCLDHLAQSTHRVFSNF